MEWMPKRKSKGASTTRTKSTPHKHKKTQSEDVNQVACHVWTLNAMFVDFKVAHYPFLIPIALLAAVS